MNKNTDFALFIEIGNSETRYELLKLDTFTNEIVRRTMPSYYSVYDDENTTGFIKIDVGKNENQGFVIGETAKILVDPIIKIDTSILEIPNCKIVLLPHFLSAVIEDNMDIFKSFRYPEKSKASEIKIVPKATVYVCISGTQKVNNYDVIFSDLKKILIGKRIYNVQFKYRAFYLEGRGGAYYIAREHPDILKFFVSDMGQGTIMANDYQNDEGVITGSVHQPIHMGCAYFINLLLSKSKDKLPLKHHLNETKLKEGIFRNIYKYVIGTVEYDYSSEIMETSKLYLSTLQEEYNFLGRIADTVRNGRYCIFIGGGWTITALQNELMRKLKDEYKISDEDLSKYLLFTNSRTLGYTEAASYFINEMKKEYESKK